MAIKFSGHFCPMHLGQKNSDERKIKEVIRRYTWRERYENLKMLVRKVTAGIALLDDEIIQIDLLFAEEDNSLRRQVFADKSIQYG